MYWIILLIFIILFIIFTIYRCHILYNMKYTNNDFIDAATITFNQWTCQKKKNEEILSKYTN